MSTIFATRRGYFYQDKYALLSFLTHFLAKDLIELYIDYPFDTPNQRSMDLKLKLKSGEGFIEKVCGIKTGENFKKDKSTENSHQIKDAFIELMMYKSLPIPDSTVLEMNLVVRPPLKDNILDCHRHLRKLDGRRNYQGEAKEAADWLSVYLSMSEFPTGRSIFPFLKMIKILDSLNDLPDSSGEDEGNLDQVIVRKIETLERDFYVTSTNHELRTELLAYNLIYLCQKYAGTGTNLVPILTAALFDFFAHRKIIHRMDSGLSLEDALRDVERRYVTWRDGTSVIASEQTLPTIVNVTEGGSLNE